jgi:hypothetical protein
MSNNYRTPYHHTTETLKPRKLAEKYIIDWKTKKKMPWLRQNFLFHSCNITENYTQPGLVTRTCNPRYWGGRDQKKDGGLKPAWENSSQDPILKNKSQKKSWWSGSRCRPWVWSPTPHTQKKKNYTYNYNTLFFEVQKSTNICSLNYFYKSTKKVENPIHYATKVNDY